MTVDSSTSTEFAEADGLEHRRAESGPLNLDEVPVSPATWKQAGHISLDASTSMNEFVEESDESREGLPPRTKAQAVEFATGELLTYLQASGNASNFALGFSSFHDSVSQDRPILPVLEIDASQGFDPTAGGTGGTSIWAGVEIAERRLLEFKATAGATLPLSLIHIILSDGECSDPSRTLAAAQHMKEQGITVAACLFATKGRPAHGAQLLQAMVSEPRFYRTVFTGEQLRKFFRDTMTATATAPKIAAAQAG